MHYLLRCGALAAAFSVSTVTQAQTANFPTRPLRLVVGFPAGGPADFFARSIAQKMTEVIGQQVIVDNRAGVSGMIAAEHVARTAPPDGYTMYFAGTGVLTFAPNLYAKLPMDVHKELMPLTLAVTVPEMLVVHPSLPVKTVKELVALAKAKPTQLNYASTGNGGITHLASELFALRTGIKITHIPYKGTGPGVIDTIAGNTQMMVAAVSAVIGHIHNKRLRGLAVSSPKRLSALPDTPTVMEAGYQYQVNNWHGVIAPKGVPTAIIDKLNSEINKAITNPDFAKRIAQDGLEPAGGTPEAFGELLKREVVEWGEVVRAANVTAN